MAKGGIKGHGDPKTAQNMHDIVADETHISLETQWM
jgi:hypothetical protein